MDVHDFGQHPMLAPAGDTHAYDPEMLGAPQGQEAWLEQSNLRHRARDPGLPLPRQGSMGVDRQSSLGSQRSVVEGTSSLYAVADQYLPQHHGVERQGSSSSYAASIPDRSGLPPVSRQSSGKSAYLAAEAYAQDAPRGVSRQGSGKSSYMAVEPSEQHAQHSIERQSSVRSYDARSQHSSVHEQDDLAVPGSRTPVEHSHHSLDRLAYHAGHATEFPQRIDSGSQGEDAVKGRMQARFEQAVRAAEQLDTSRSGDEQAVAGRGVAPPETPEQPADPRLKIGSSGLVCRLELAVTAFLHDSLVALRISNHVSASLLDMASCMALAMSLEEAQGCCAAATDMSYPCRHPALPVLTSLSVKSSCRLARGQL